MVSQIIVCCLEPTWAPGIPEERLCGIPVVTDNCSELKLLCHDGIAIHNWSSLITVNVGASVNKMTVVVVNL